MKQEKQPDEQPKRKVADQVVTPKRLYFIPAIRRSVEAADYEDAVAQAEKVTEKEEEGDGNK